MESYKNFAQNNSNDSSGKTVKYWVIYVDIFHLYHQLSQCVRTRNIDLITAFFPKITTYLFALNQSNCAKWTVYYLDSLLKLSDFHTEVYKEFQIHLFGIKRAKKSFSRQPIDLILEQTIKDDAASQITEISLITNSIIARQKWANSHFVRVSVTIQITHEWVNLDWQKMKTCYQILKSTV